MRGPDLACLYHSASIRRWPSILFQWNETAVRWFEEASKYTGFHENLKQLILPNIACRETLVDLGCGAGLIDLALADSIGHITCVDKNEGVIGMLRAGILKRGIGNIEAICQDAETLSGQWDTVLAVFYGRIDESLSKLLSMCRESVIAVVHADAQGKLGPTDYHPPKCNTVSLTSQALDALGARYTVIEDALEYGQPLRSLAEAADFVRFYSKNPPDTSVDAYLEACLTVTCDPVYPYYLPNKKGFGIFILGRDDNAHL